MVNRTICLQDGDMHTLKMVLLIMSEWMAATPLTALLPTTARYAIFTSLHMPEMMPQEALLEARLYARVTGPTNKA